MRQKSKFVERYGRANRGFRPRNKPTITQVEMPDPTPGRRKKLAL